MADTKKTFPMLPVAHWWALRKKFKQSIPGVVSINYLSSVLDMGEASARANIYPFLKTLGIVDDDGKPTPRAKQWRDDGHYSEVCKAILQEVYPSDLRDAVDSPRENREAAKRWFANHTGAGDAACSRMAALYTILVEADPKGAGTESKKPTLKPTKKTKMRVPAPAAPPAAKSESQAPQNDSRRSDGPDVNLNLQIHISADASTDQIDQIFASMAKHIYRRA